MRHKRHSATIPTLAASLDDMVTVVERRRRGHDVASQERNERQLRECVTVMVWEEADGSETVSVVGSSDIPPLEMKGVLHDGLYALTHLQTEDARSTRLTSGR